MPRSSHHHSEGLDSSALDQELDASVIVVKHRPGGFSPLLLPPLLIVILGALFLGYRASESNWQGLSWERLASLWPSHPNRHDATPGPDLALNSLATDPASTEKEASPEPETGGASAEPATATASPTEKSEAEFLDEIRRESERAKERNAELERVK
jgi:hypothetical protein